MSGRKQTNVEFIVKLRDLLEITTMREFARKCGKNESNISDYLNGKRVPGNRVLRNCLDNIAQSELGWPIEAEREIRQLAGGPAMPTSGGVYILYDSGGNVLYIGKATNLRSEVKVALGRAVPVGLRLGADLSKKVHPKLEELAACVSLYLISDGLLRHNVEALLLRVFPNQTHNLNVGRFKIHPQ